MSQGQFQIKVAWAEQVPELTDAGLRATFAEFEINVGDQVITRHANGPSLFARLFVPLAPIATWFAKNWPEILGGATGFATDENSDAHSAIARLDADQWREREEEIDHWLRTHALRFVGDGLLLPDLIIWRLGAVVSLSWRGWCPDVGVEFLGRGHVEVPVQDFADEIREFVGRVRERLDSVGANSAARVELARAVGRMDDPWGPAGLQLVAQRIGRPVTSLRAWLEKKKEPARALIITAYQVAPDDATDPIHLDSPVAMAARSAGPRLSDVDHEKILALGESLQKCPPTRAFRVLRDHLPKEVGPAFPQASDGYRRANGVRRLATVATRRFFDVEGYLRSSGCEVKDVEFDDALTDGVVLWNREERLIIAANASSPRVRTAWGRRAMLAHELYHLVFDARDQRFFGESTSSGMSAPSERAASAFAAQLLLPDRFLPRNVSQFWTNLSAASTTVQALCTDFGVGRELVVRQLQNHRKLPPPVVEVLLSET